ncbi:MAG: transcription antitermination factor NusB, partial [Endomicrobiales bacterium]
MHEANPRLAALTILNLYQPQKTNLSHLMAGFLGRAGDLSDKGLVRDLVWGVVRYLTTIDWLIGLFAQKPGSLEPPVRNILRLGVFQIVFYEGKVPEYAAVNESVELTRRIGRASAARMVNAVLRGLGRKKDNLPWPEEGKDPGRAVALRYAHPGWMAARWLRRLGREEAVRLCKANNAAAPLTVRVNTLAISREGLREALEKEGVPSEVTRCSPDGLILKVRPEIEKLETFRKGFFLVQEEASQLVSLMLDARPGETLLDLCCGAGIKASHLAQITGG